MDAWSMRTGKGDLAEWHRLMAGVERDPEICAFHHNAAAFLLSEAASPAFEAFVRKVAARTKCDEPGTQCGFGSGPHCDWHGTGEDAELIDEARAILASSPGSGQPTPTHGKA